MFPFTEQSMYARRIRIINGKEYDYVKSDRTKEAAIVSMDVLRRKGFKCRLVKQKSKYLGVCYDIFCSR